MARRKKEKKGYFYEKEEEAIVRYLTASTESEKNEIFRTILYPAFTKMIESIIRRYKLYVPDEDFELTFTDVISYLITKIDNFDPTKGYKAYSYCGTVCKNYLYYKCSQYTKKSMKNESYDSMADELNNIGFVPDRKEEEEEFTSNLINRTVDTIQEMVDNTEDNELTEDEVKVGRALIALFKNWNTILTEDGSNKLQKSSVLYFLREETMMTTKKVRDNMKPFKSIYGLIKEIMLKEEE